MNTQQSLLKAYLLASSEHYDQAFDLLNADPLLKSDETALELRARILFEKGDKASAKREWMNLLQINPNNETAKEVLANITGFRGWLWFQGKYLVAVLLFIAFVLGGFYTGKTSRETSPIKTPPTVESVYAEFVIPTNANNLTTASLQGFLTTNKFERQTLLIFSEHPDTAVTVTDMAVNFGFPSENIICLPMRGDSSSFSVLRIIAGQNMEFRYDN